MPRLSVSPKRALVEPLGRVVMLEAWHDTHSNALAQGFDEPEAVRQADALSPRGILDSQASSYQHQMLGRLSANALALAYTNCESCARPHVGGGGSICSKCEKRVTLSMSDSVSA